MAYAPDGTLLSVGQDRFFRVWDVNAGKETKTLQQTPDKQDDLYGLAISPDGKSAATSGYAGWVTVWSLADGKPTWAKKLPAPCAYCVAFTPDGKSLVTGHDLLPGAQQRQLLCDCHWGAVTVERRLTSRERQRAVPSKPLAGARGWYDSHSRQPQLRDGNAATETDLHVRPGSRRRPW